MNCPQCNHPIERHAKGCTVRENDAQHTGSCCSCLLHPKDIEITALKAQNADLLGALEMCVNALEDDPLIPTDQETEALKVARAAIASAEEKR